MKRGQVVWLIALAAFACAVEGVNLVGFWYWKTFVDELAIDANAATHRLAEGGGFSWPSTVHWSRQLSAQDLVAADVINIVAGLNRLGAVQKKWFVSDSNGPKNSARAALLHGDVGAAIAEIRSALKRDPTSPYLHRLLAMVLRQVGDPKEVLDHLATAEGLAPNFKSPPVDLVPADEKWVREEGLRRRLEFYPRQRVAGLIALANYQRSSGDAEVAWQTLEGVRNEAEVMLIAAGWMIKEDRFSEAIELLGELTSRRRYPSKIRARAYSLTAQAHDLNDEPGLARTAADQALRLAPDSASPYLALASIAERRGNLDAAFNYVRKARSIDPRNVGLLLRLARLAEKTGNDKEALSAFVRATEIDTSSPKTVAQLVDFYLRRGDFMAAAMQLSRSLERFPMDPRLLRQAEHLRNEVSR